MQSHSLGICTAQPKHWRMEPRPHSNCFIKHLLCRSLCIVNAIDYKGENSIVLAVHGLSTHALTKSRGGSECIRMVGNWSKRLFPANGPGPSGWVNWTFRNKKKHCNPKQTAVRNSGRSSKCHGALLCLEKIREAGAVDTREYCPQWGTLILWHVQFKSSWEVYDKTEG